MDLLVLLSHVRPWSMCPIGWSPAQTGMETRTEKCFWSGGAEGPSPATRGLFVPKPYVGFCQDCENSYSCGDPW